MGERGATAKSEEGERGGEEMERLRPGERKGKDKKREQKRIDWGGKQRKVKWKLNWKSKQALRQTTVGKNRVCEIRREKRGGGEERRGGEKVRGKITLKDSNRVRGTQLKREKPRGWERRRQQRRGESREGKIRTDAATPSSKDSASFLPLVYSSASPESPLRFFLWRWRRKPLLWNPSTSLRLPGNHKTPQRSDYLSQWSWIKLFN